MKLIREFTEEIEVGSITEEKDGKKDYYIQGVFLQTEMKNRNGRYYIKETVDREVKRYDESCIQKNRAYGELGHPDKPTINLDRASHLIKELKEDGNNWIGKAKIMDTPMGNIVKALMDEGASLGVSSRGIGSLTRKKDYNVVNDDFMLSTAADIVADPSAPDAFVQGIYEGVEWVWNNGVLVEQEAEKIKYEIDNSGNSLNEEKKLQLFKRFIDSF